MPWVAAQVPSSPPDPALLHTPKVRMPDDRVRDDLNRAVNLRSDATATLGGVGMRCRAASNATVSILADGRPGFGDASPTASLAQ